MNTHYSNVLVPLDGSKQAEMALQKGAKITVTNEGHLDILMVLNTSQYGYSYGGLVDGDVINNLVDDSTAYLKQQLADLQKKYPELNANIHIRFGNPKTVISFEFPKDYHSDLIVMGATGMGRLQRVVEGSVTAFVNRNATCDVIVVRTDLNNEPIKSVK
ncbi:universal stress protein [Lentilactobacillus senioris]|uniref:universal stress protein n=1 Tax=Lentilactobacillus senioris TaxID=931534 RepID=UPI00227F1F00|nr:universal stress protein [Lentilactobacillus senioris]MCY9806486.1 universal stress protein [Lentilactobacillus senioris]